MRLLKEIKGVDMSNLEITTNQFKKLSNKEAMSVIHENMKTIITKLDQVHEKQDVTNGKVKFHTKALVALWSTVIFLGATLFTVLINHVLS